MGRKTRNDGNLTDSRRSARLEQYYVYILSSVIRSLGAEPVADRLLYRMSLLSKLHVYEVRRAKTDACILQHGGGRGVWVKMDGIGEREQHYTISRKRFHLWNGSHPTYPSHLAIIQPLPHLRILETTKGDVLDKQAIALCTSRQTQRLIRC